MNRVLLSVFLPLFLLLAPAMASAQLPQIVPCGTVDNPCDACDAFALVSNSLTWLVSIVTLVITLVVVWAGIKIAISRGNPGEVSAARGMLTNAIIGFAILLCAWLIVDTAIRMLVGDDTFGRPWYEISQEELDQCEKPPRTGGTVTGPGGTPSGTVTEGSYEHGAALSELQEAGIAVTSTAGPGGVQANCPTGNGCTSLQGVREDTIAQTVNFANALREECPTCQVTVTGCTEPGHAAGTHSHANGYKIDIEDTSDVNSFIENNLERVGDRNGDPVYHDSCDNEYVRESTHWDITVYGTCPI